jgi:hypothetical protein
MAGGIRPWLACILMGLGQNAECIDAPYAVPVIIKTNASGRASAKSLARGRLDYSISATQALSGPREK